jgi:hypothetical protein
MSGATPQLYDLRVSHAPLDPERISKFARAAARGIAGGISEVGGPWIGSGDLTALMSISAWMSQAGTDLPDSLDSMLLLRTALVRASGLDEQSEPVPLLPPDDRVAVVNMARYLEDLVCRASNHSECSTEDVAERAIELLVA